MLVQISVNIKQNDEIGVKDAERRSTKEADHWVFLEEIDAPMWADLTLDSVLVTEDNDDPWFQTSHPFHQRSARHLRSAFSHSDVRNDHVKFNLLGMSSPKLPSSVSKSRGKDYRSNKWGISGRFLLNKGHPVNDLGARVSGLEAGSSQESKLRGSCGSHIGHSGSFSSLHDDNSCITTVSDSSLGMTKVSDTRGVLNSQSVSTSERVSTSTMTAESSLQQHSKVLEVSKEGCSYTSGLLNALKTNLRRSVATRPAMRLEISVDKESKGCNSSPGKSSIGSSNMGCDSKSKVAAVMQKPVRQRQVKGEINVNSRGSKGCSVSSGNSKNFSSHPKFEPKKLAAGLKQNKNRNINARNLGRVAQPIKEIGKVSFTDKASFLTTNAYASRTNGQNTAAASSCSEPRKLKVLCPNQPSAKSQGIKSKVGINSQFSEHGCSGKENMDGRPGLSVRPDVKTWMPVVRESNQKISKLKSENKVGRSVALKPVRTRGGNDCKPSMEAHVYLR